MILATIDTWWLAAAGIAGIIAAVAALVGGMWRIAHDNGSQTQIVKALFDKLDEFKEIIESIVERNDREHEAIRRENAEERTNIWNHLRAEKELHRDTRERVVAIEAEKNRRRPA